jgi:predicted nucleic acid-binding protein
MNVIDSSVWLEYFAKSQYAYQILPIIKDSDNLIVPSITILEVFKKILREYSENKALTCISYMKLGRVISLDDDLAINSGHYGLKYKLPLADSIIFATALYYKATLYTSDKHFEGLPNVKYFEKK